MSAWLHIIGVSEAGVAALPPASRAVVAGAQTVLGPARLLAQLDAEDFEPPPAANANESDHSGLEAVARALHDVDESIAIDAAPSPAPRPRLVEWRGSLEAMVAQVTGLRGAATVILATGDPLWFGIGATLTRHLAANEFDVLPAPSSFQLAAAAMRWPLQHVATLSLHGRRVELIHPHILPANRILALTSDATTAPAVAETLVSRGYGESLVTVLEDLGGPSERILSTPAAQFKDQAIGDFYVLAIDCVASAGAGLLPAVPGLPDSAFVSDGQLTKREIRAATLSKLAPTPGALLWDIGAGCGSIAIEWMRAARDAGAIAFERDESRLRMIATNAAALGVPGLVIAPGDALSNLAGRPAPDAVFLGGAVADEPLFAACWSALRPGGRLVANAVTVDGEQALHARHARLGGELVRIETSLLEPLGEHQAFRPRLPVTQWSATKPGAPR